MIHSSINDNWMRVEIMHSVAKTYYLATHDSDFRKRMMDRGNPFPFDVEKYESMEKESCIVGMVMAWSVVTLESLVNQVIAERVNNKTSAIMAIEYPGQITEKLKIARSARSELAKKLVILADSAEHNAEYISLADELSETRNLSCMISHSNLSITEMEKWKSHTSVPAEITQKGSIGTKTLVISIENVSKSRTMLLQNLQWMLRRLRK